MVRVGLTGGIGSGKSTVAKIFEVLGIPVYYADDAAKQIMNTDQQLKAALIKNFGEKPTRAVNSTVLIWRLWFLLTSKN